MHSQLYPATLWSNVFGGLQLGGNRQVIMTVSTNQNSVDWVACCSDQLVTEQVLSDSVADGFEGCLGGQIKPTVSANQLKAYKLARDYQCWLFSGFIKRLFSGCHYQVLFCNSVFGVIQGNTFFFILVFGVISGRNFMTHKMKLQYIKGIQKCTNQKLAKCPSKS